MPITRQYPDTVVPKTAVLEMTYRCNHRCLFCSVPWEGPRGDYPRESELTIPGWLSCVEELARQGIQNIAFSGGEPLLKKGLEEVIHYAATVKTAATVFDGAGKAAGKQEKNITLSLITNGALINDHWVNIFKQHRVSMVVSLPGIEAFGVLTGGGDYRRALQAIKKLSDAGLDVVVSICVTKKNLPELIQTISQGFLHGAKALLLNRFLPGGRGIDYPELCLDQNEIIRMLDCAQEVCLAANTRGSVGTELPKCILTKDYSMLTVGTMCSGGIDFFAVDPAGNVRPCNHSPVVLGRYTNITAAIRTNYWQRFKQRDFLPQACSSCALSCVVTAAAGSGAYHCR
jgi:Predicted Fe-S oxidoreductases